jgi:hypothetical protein
MPVLQGRKSFCLTILEEYKLHVLENRILRDVSGLLRGGRSKRRVENYVMKGFEVLLFTIYLSDDQMKADKMGDG